MCGECFHGSGGVILETACEIRGKVKAKRTWSKGRRRQFIRQDNAMLTEPIPTP